MNAHWTLGVLVGIPILVVLFAACIVCAILVPRIKDRIDDHYAGRTKGEPYFSGKAKRWVRLTFAALAFLVLAFAALGYFPYKAEYHRWTPVSGTVENVSSRLIPAGENGVQQRFVVVVNGQKYGVDDTRASLLKKGDQVSLYCLKEWQYASAPGYGCRWG